MSSAPLEIQVVYSSSSRGRKGAGRVVRHRTVGATTLALLGLLNFAAAGGLYYWTWWVQDSEIYMTLMLNTPIKGVGADVTKGLTKGAKAPSTVVPNTESPTTADGPRYTGDTAVAIMGGSAYGWLTLATIAACCLAMSSGGAWRRFGGSGTRWMASLAAIGVLAALGLGGYQIWTEYGGSYPTKYLRMGMGGLVLVAFLFGLGVVGNVRRWTNLAALAILISAVGSVVGLYLGHECGAIDAAQVTPEHLGKVFGMQSAWGWILIPFAWRLPRA